MLRLPLFVLCAFVFDFPAPAQTPPAAVRSVPPVGIQVPEANRAEIEEGLEKLASAVADLRKRAAGDEVIRKELPNVEIFHKSADWALRYDEIFDKKQIPVVKEQIKQGLERARGLADGKTPWNEATGLLVRAYRSAIDDSVQPYGLVVPADYHAGDGKKRPLHFWCHGRNEKLSELAFIADRQKNPGEFVPEGAIVCHLYGRFCNANKFAGEMDLFEALADIRNYYTIDEARLIVRGFSMGGAACWQFATHYAGLWAAAAPGAGFAETAEFFNVFAPGKEAPPPWEQKLWRWYDCTTMAGNLANTKVVAYSGEIDKQKQAADIMLKYAEKEGLTFSHIIGPQTAHKYHPDSKPRIEEAVNAAVQAGREAEARKGRWTTYSLIYPSSDASRAPVIVAMEKQWERADLEWDATDASAVAVKTRNIAAFTWKPTAKGSVSVDGQKLELKAQRGSARGYRFTKVAGNWSVVEDGAREEGGKLRKQPGLCGPIDHAFMSRFVFVRPTGKAVNETVGAWTKVEFEHAVNAWRRVFRGDVRVVNDTQLTEGDVTSSNLVLWGDSSSNAVLKRIVSKLPLQWDASTLEVGGHKVDAAHHVPILIYPNPLNPAKYVVINSGFTFRETAALNNSDQTPKLPDWAVIDLRTPPGPKWPGKVVEAGFFDESWK